MNQNPTLTLYSDLGIEMRIQNYFLILDKDSQTLEEMEQYHLH